MSYGGVDISPVPIISIRRDNRQVGNRENPIAYNFSMTLNGTLTALPSDGGLIVTAQLMEDLREIFNVDGKQLLIQCGPDGGPYTDVISLYPKITNISFAESNNNWVDTIPYSIELTFDADSYDEHPDGNIPPFIEEYSEEWNVEFVNDNKHFVWDLSQVTDQQGGYDYTTTDSNNPFEARVTHAVTVKGKQSWTGTGVLGTMTKAADNALDWALNTFGGFGYDSTGYGHAISGWTNLGGSSGNAYDHFRTHSINETEGTVTLNENWIVLGINSGILSDGRKIMEDFTVEIRTGNEDGLTRMSINGSVNGVAEMSYSTVESSTNVVTSAYDNASNGWSYVMDRVFPRAQLIYEQQGSRQLHPTPLTKSISHSPGKGIIGYSYEFNDRPCSFISGALSENFSIVDNHPSDVFARIPVLGRAAGPVLQEISTVTESTREVSIEAVMPPPTGCSSISLLDTYKPTTIVANILCEFETQLTDVYDQVFKQSDTESWNPLSGRYSRNVSWIYQSCSGTPSTSFCD
jgi:hypothetical protein